jgi:hypothetical protein
MKAFTGGQTGPLSRGFLLGALDRAEKNDSAAGHVSSTARHDKFDVSTGVLQRRQCARQTAGAVCNFTRPYIHFGNRIRHIAPPRLIDDLECAEQKQFQPASRPQWLRRLFHSTGAAPAAVIRDAVSAAHSTGFRRGQEQRFTLISIGSFGAGF